MVKPRSGTLGKLPKGQQCEFIIGPVSSWFMPNISDIWTKPIHKTIPENEGSMDYEDPNKLVMCLDDDLVEKMENSHSYYIYGSIGCFCYGPIKHYQRSNQDEFELKLHGKSKCLSASITNLVDIKEDNSRVICIRFLKTHHQPIVMVLTDNGSLIIHDCSNSENMIHFRKNELILKLIGESNISDHNLIESSQQSLPSKKKPKMNISQQINSFVWPQSRHAFLGISLLREKRNELIWLKMKDITGSRLANGHQAITKTDLIESHELLNLDLERCTNPICCMECSQIDSTRCTIALAMDDGLIVIVNVNYSTGQLNRVIKLARHNDQISSLSIFTGDERRYPSGLLASVGRDGLVLIWDIENELYFADYHARGSQENSKQGNRINWFALDFIRISDITQTLYLAVSNCDSGITLLEVPERVRSKVRLKDNNNIWDKRSRTQMDDEEKTCIRHHALVFNLVFDPISNTVGTCSLDGNHILWSCNRNSALKNSNNSNNNNNNNACKKSVSSLAPIKLKAEFLIPTMPNNARTHMIRHSPIREDLMGLALGKAGIRFHSVPQLEMNRSFQMSHSHNMIARKITKSGFTPTSLAWNPVHEYRLAIGTIEGKVLRADMTPRMGTLIECIRSSDEDCRKNNSSFSVGDQKTAIDGGDLFGVEYQPVERSLEREARVNSVKNDVDIGNHNDNDNNNHNDNDDAKMDNDNNYPKTDGVYSLCWGPNPIQPEDPSRQAIYAVGSRTHRLFIYYGKKESSEKMTDYLSEIGHGEMGEIKANQLSTCINLPECYNEASEVLWKCNRDLMALGTITGKVILVNYNVNDMCPNNNLKEPNDSKGIRLLFNRLAVIEGPMLASSRIQCLAWHPSGDRDDPYYHYLAVSSSELTTALVFNLRLKDRRIEKEFGGEDSKKIVDLSSLKSHYVNDALNEWSVDHVMTLDSHKKAISDIAWNPHIQNQLATASFDRLCLVWTLQDKQQEKVIGGEDIKPEATGSLHKSSFIDSINELCGTTTTPSLNSQEQKTKNKAHVISKFCARDRLFTVEWSLHDEDLIFTSGHDSTVWAWTVSDQTKSN